MQSLATDPKDKIRELAQRFGVSPGAVTVLYQALIQGNGQAAQFNHPELGGMGQWLSGGMTMVGNMFDPNLKGRIQGLCAELSQLLANQSAGVNAAQPWGVESGSVLPPGNMVEGAVLPMTSLAGGWWPPEMGHPAASGMQNELRYAYFPESNRLAVADKGQTTIYNTLGYSITGVAQQQGPANTLTFTTPAGLLRVVDMPVISITDQIQNPAGPALE